MDIVSLSSYQEGNWTHFVREMLKRYPEKKEIVIYHPADLINLVMRTKQQERPRTYAEVMAFYKSFAPISKDCLEHGKISKEHETEIFIEALHPELVIKLDQQAEQRAMLKRWAEDMGLLVPASRQRSPLDMEEDIFKLATRTEEPDASLNDDMEGRDTVEELLEDIEAI